MPVRGKYFGGMCAISVRLSWGLWEVGDGGLGDWGTGGLGDLGTGRLGDLETWGQHYSLFPNPYPLTFTNR